MFIDIRLHVKNVHPPLLIRAFCCFPPPLSTDRNADRFTNLEFYRVTVAVQLAIYNGVILAWREKVCVSVFVYACYYLPCKGSALLNTC